MCVCRTPFQQLLSSKVSISVSKSRRLTVKSTFTRNLKMDNSVLTSLFWSRPNLQGCNAAHFIMKSYILQVIKVEKLSLAS